LAALAQVEQHLTDVDVELNRLSTSEPWASSMPYLVQLPGLGLITALTVLAAVGDVTRFETAKQLVGYAGLGASVHDSGQTHRTGRITKTGRRDLRHVLVEAAWAAVEHHPYWKVEFARLARRMDDLRQSSRGHCPALAGRYLACADRAGGGPACGARDGRHQAHALVVGTHR